MGIRARAAAALAAYALALVAQLALPLIAHAETTTATNATEVLNETVGFVDQLKTYTVRLALGFAGIGVVIGAVEWRFMGKSIVEALKAAAIPIIIAIGFGVIAFFARFIH